MRRSTSTPRASLIASAMSWLVTEPKRRPSSPAWLRDRQDGLGELLGELAGLRRSGLRLRALGGGGELLRPRRARALRRRLGELARDQVVAQVALGDVDDGALASPSVLDVLEQDGLGHQSRSRSRSRSRPPAADAARSRGLGGVRAASASSRARLTARGDLALVTAAGAGDAARADLAALGDEPAQRRRRPCSRRARSCPCRTGRACAGHCRARPSWCPACGTSAVVRRCFATGFLEVRCYGVETRAEAAARGALSMTKTPRSSAHSRLRDGRCRTAARASS